MSSSASRPAGGPGYRTIQAEALAPHDSELKLAFPAPYAELSRSPEVFQRQWKLLNYAFGLPDPSTFPALDLPLPSEDFAAIRRYILTSRELASFTMLTEARRLQLSGGVGKETEASLTMPSKEVILGFAVRFRQLHSDDPASYTVVKNIISRALGREGQPLSTTGGGQIRQWKRARAELLKFSLDEIVQMKVLKAEWAPGSTIPAPDNLFTPSELIELFQYGEYIHWGDHRDLHSAIQRNPALSAILEFRFHNIQIGLTHLYFGFARLAEAALANWGANDTTEPISAPIVP